MPDHFMNYVECDAAEGLTLKEWRRASLGPAVRRRRPWWRQPFARMLAG